MEVSSAHGCKDGNTQCATACSLADAVRASLLRNKAAREREREREKEREDRERERERDRERGEREREIEPVYILAVVGVW